MGLIPASIIHFKIAMIVSLGIILANLIDVDHLPGIFRIKQYNTFDCLLNPYCKPKENVGNPLHSWWFVTLFIFITILSFKYSPNPLITFFFMGLTLGFVIHIMADGYWYPYFQEWFKSADNFKQKILGVN